MDASHAHIHTSVRGYTRSRISSLTLVTSLLVTPTPQLITSSDRRLKENIYGIQDILAIEVKDYNFITDADEHIKTGFIAQQLHTIFPTAVAVGDDVKTNPWGVDYAGLTPLFVKGMQDKQEKIDQIKMENETLRIKNEELKIKNENHDTRLQKLEQQNDEMKAMLEAIQARVNNFDTASNKT
ncbi:MAG: tail fiber domain-containing protein [Bacteroidota bacterium]